MNEQVENPRHYCFVIKFQYHWDNNHALLIDECSHPYFSYACISRYTNEAEAGTIYIKYKARQSLSKMIARFKTFNVSPSLFYKFPRLQGQSDFIEYGEKPLHNTKPRHDRDAKADLYKELIKKRKRELLEVVIEKSLIDLNNIIT